MAFWNTTCKESKTTTRNPGGIFLLDDQGGKAAGPIGETHGIWLSINYLWASRELRNQHICSSILEQAKETAKKQGCTHVFLDTFDFQTPQFRARHGYDEAFVLEGYPCTGKRDYFTTGLWTADSLKGLSPERQRKTPLR